VTGSRQSFYDSRGEIDGDRLAAIASMHGMGDMRAIGWFVGQKNRGTLRPSVRDAAVHRRLSQALAAGGAAEPCMLLLLNLEVDERASTQSVDYVCLSQLDPPSLRLSPVQSAVLNLTHDSLHEYGQLRALGNAHANAASLPASDVPPAHIVAFGTPLPPPPLSLPPARRPHYNWLMHPPNPPLLPQSGRSTRQCAASMPSSGMWRKWNSRFRN
jgi:hypothetical protein